MAEVSMKDIKPNSYKSKEMIAKVEEPDRSRNIEKVVTGGVKTKKKSLGSKFADTFVTEDAGNVKNYIFLEVLVPAVKSAISDMVSTGIEMLLYGESKGRKRGSGYRSSHTSYSSYYDDRDRVSARRSYADRDRRSNDDLIFDSRNDAEDVLCRMFEVLERYDNVSVQDLNEMVGKRSDYTDQNWGWTDLRDASVSRVRDGYLLKLPRPEYLK